MAEAGGGPTIGGGGEERRAASTGARHNRYNRFRFGRAHTQICSRHHSQSPSLYGGSYAGAIARPN